MHQLPAADEFCTECSLLILIVNIVFLGRFIPRKPKIPSIRKGVESCVVQWDGQVPLKMHRQKGKSRDLSRNDCENVTNVTEASETSRCCDPRKSRSKTEVNRSVTSVNSVSSVAILAVSATSLVLASSVISNVKSASLIQVVPVICNDTGHFLHFLPGKSRTKVRP